LKNFGKVSRLRDEIKNFGTPLCIAQLTSLASLVFLSGGTPDWKTGHAVKFRKSPPVAKASELIKLTSTSKLAVHRVADPQSEGGSSLAITPAKFLKSCLVVRCNKVQPLWSTGRYQLFAALDDVVKLSSYYSLLRFIPRHGVRDQQFKCQSHCLCAHYWLFPAWAHPKVYG